MLFTLPLPATYEAVERPVVFQITRQLMNMGLLPLVNRIVYQDTIDQVKLNESSHCDTASAHFDTSGYIEVKTTRVIQEKASGVRIDYNESPVIFNDTKHKLTMSTIQQSVDLEFSFTVVTTSLAHLRNYKASVRHRLNVGNQINEHIAAFTYALPFKTWEWLYDMHKLMDTDWSLMEWFTEYVDNGAELITSGTHHEVAMATTQHGIDGHVFEKPNEIQRNTQTGVYKIEMGYKIKYDMPEHVVFNHPIMINQTMVPDKYLPPERQLPSVYYTDSPIANFKPPVATTQQVVRIPQIDREPLDRYPPDYSPLLTVLVSISDLDSTECFNLFELGDVMIDRTLLKSFKVSEAFKTLTTPYKSPFILTVHNHQTLLHSDTVEVDDELTVTFTSPPDKAGVYRVSLCILDAPQVLPNNTIKELQTYTEYFCMYVELLNWRGVTKSSLKEHARKSIAHFKGSVDCIRYECTGCKPPYVKYFGLPRSIPKSAQTTYVNVF